jgi:hypothetical protein
VSYRLQSGKQVAINAAFVANDEKKNAAPTGVDKSTAAPSRPGTPYIKGHHFPRRITTPAGVARLQNRGLGKQSFFSASFACVKIIAKLIAPLLSVVLRCSATTINCPQSFFI